MPRANSGLMTDTPRGLRPFAFLGVEFGGGEQASAQCPFCGDERGKFRVNAQSGLWDCKRCGRAGNPLKFLRELWDVARAELEAGSDCINLLAEDRGLGVTTLDAWGIVESPINGDVLVPGWTPDGKLWQLYRYAPNGNGKRVLMPCPAVHPDGSAHGLFMPAGGVKKGAGSIYVCEGPWDGMALWEVAEQSRGGIIAVPGCNVWSDRWLPIVAGKPVTFLYDNDAPREFPPKSGKFRSAGYAGMLRAAHLCRPKATSVSGVVWGPNGYDPELPDGWDVRDQLGQRDVERTTALGQLLARVAPLDGIDPSGNVAERRPTGGGGKDVEPAECRRWVDLINSWRKALYWLPDLEDTLATMCAVSVSTLRVGDQLFLQVIADAGSAKTRFCDALLVSKHNFPLEHLTSFHSGWKDASGEDFSLIARINGRCMITPEGDVLMSSPRFAELMSQQRRIFDGTTGSTYGNRKEDIRHTGLRTPWIMAGTPALLDTDQSRLGDRFLRIRMRPPGRDAKRNILLRVGHAALDAVMMESNCSAASQVEGRMLEAYQLTGGYVDWLWENINGLLAGLQFDRDALVERCADMGELVADLRARPNEDARKKETHDTKELPTRLTAQFARLATCLAAVMNRSEPDAEVMARVKKVARDTAAGRTWEIVATLAEGARAAGVRPADPQPMTSEGIAVRTGEQPAKTRALLAFLRKIDVVEMIAPAATANGIGAGIGRAPRFGLTPRVAALWRAFHAG